MPSIPRSYVEALTRSLNMLSKATQSAVEAQLLAITYTDLADLRRQVIAILEPILGVATDYAAAYSAQTYDMVREYSVGEANGAIAYSGRIPEATVGAVRALIGLVRTNGIESFVKAIKDRCDYEIKRAAGESTLYNVERDPKKPRFARVPTGAETCDFCLMLASRGFVYLSEKSAGANDHWHPHCDCRIIQGYPGDTVEGYDPDELYRLWKSKNNDISQNSDGYEIEDGAQPLPKEKAVASWLSRQGFEVEFRKTRASEGLRTSDLLIEGKPWEIKQPTGSGRWNISNQFNEAKGQSSRLILDVSKSPFSKEYIEEEVRRQLERRNDFDEVMLIDENYFKRIAR